MKQCTRCKTTKEYAEFHKRSTGSKDGLQNECKACHAIKSHEWYVKNKQRSLTNSKAWAKRNPQKSVQYHRKERYGITSEEYNAMLKAQNERCAICNRHPSEFRRQFHVDHCHKTKKVRGLLCCSCNLGLGSFNDNVDRLQLAIAYLQRTI